MWEHACADWLAADTTREPLEPRHSAHIAGASLGAGSTEVSRRELSDAEVRAVITAEADERDQAAVGYRQAGRGDRAARLAAEASAIRAVLDAG